METTEYYNLTYTTSLGKTKALRVNSPNFDLSTSEVHAAAMGIMAGNVFDKEKTGSLAGIKKMERVSVVRNTVI